MTIGGHFVTYRQNVFKPDKRNFKPKGHKIQVLNILVSDYVLKDSSITTFRVNILVQIGIKAEHIEMYRNTLF